MNVDWMILSVDMIWHCQKVEYYLPYFFCLQSLPELKRIYADFLVGRNISQRDIFTYTFDAVWAIALTLHNVLLSSDGAPLLENFQQRSSELATILFRELTNLKFYGASVSTTFSNLLCLYIPVWNLKYLHLKIKFRMCIIWGLIWIKFFHK